MSTALLTFDCEGAHHDRCFSSDYIKILEEEFIPATWFIHSSLKDPTANAKLYFSEYFHKIPNWHEVGMKVNFENERGYIEDEHERGNVIRIAKDTLKSRNIKASSFRAGCFALTPPDIKYLEDVEILVDSSIIPDADYKMFVDWAGAPKAPYYGSKDDLTKPGNNKVLHIPVATYQGNYCYLDRGFKVVEEILNSYIDEDVVCIGVRDYYDSTEDLAKTIKFLRRNGFEFATLTQMGGKYFGSYDVESRAS